MNELYQNEIRNCLSLAMDSYSSRIVELTSDIEEQLGLISDRKYRFDRLEILRKSALDQCIFPMMEPSFTASVINYDGFLFDKRSILRNIFTCCKDFCDSMKLEVDLLCASEDQAKEDNGEFSQYGTDSQGSGDGSGDSSDSSHEMEKRQKRNRLPSDALQILWQFLRTHKNNPYPSTQQKEQLAKETKLTLTQIRNWFTNTRKRKLTQNTDSDEDYSLESDRDESSRLKRLDSGRQKHFDVGRQKRHLNRKKTVGNTSGVNKNGFSRRSLVEKRQQEDEAEKSNTIGRGQWIQYGTEGMETVQNRRLVPKQKRTVLFQDPQLQEIDFDSKRVKDSQSLFELPPLSKEFCLNNGFAVPSEKQNFMDMAVCVCGKNEM